jgi:hypothetical protein
VIRDHDLHIPGTGGRPGGHARAITEDRRHARKRATQCHPFSAFWADSAYTRRIAP